MDLNEARSILAEIIEHDTPAAAEACQTVLDELEGDEGWARRRLADLEAAALDVVRSGSIDPGNRRVIVPADLFDALRRLVPING